MATDLAKKFDELDKDLHIQAPPVKLTVQYPNHLSVDFGNELTPTQVQHRPVEIAWNAKSNALYTVAMVDPDAPSRQDPTMGQVAHWLVVNIPGNQLDKGLEISEYIGSGAPQGTGLHRYCFLVFEQTAGELPADCHPKASKFSRNGRRNFKIADFVKKFNLSGPIAGNYFKAQYDDYVPSLHAQLSKEQ